ncbi:hypothetical protein SNEBB_009306 [Seison nebaliae]|nr:hypothetical protein SNEBB_009306 [Seison nebaliae]
MNNDSIPQVLLYVRRSNIDCSHRSSCPASQRMFMILYNESQMRRIKLTVFPVNMKMPEPEFRDFHAHPPVLVVNDNVVLTDNFLIEKYIFANLMSTSMKSKRSAESIVADVYSKFNIYLKSSTPETLERKKGVLNRELGKINDFLKSNGTEFLSDDNLTQVDCEFLPKLQHILIVGKAYMNYEIPKEFVHLWKYLQNGYEAKAFRESCPYDQDMILHYSEKINKLPLGKNPNLQKPTFTLEIPQEMINPITLLSTRRNNSSDKNLSNSQNNSPINQKPLSQSPGHSPVPIVTTTVHYTKKPETKQEIHYSNNNGVNSHQFNQIFHQSSDENNQSKWTPPNESDHSQTSISPNRSTDYQSKSSNNDNNSLRSSVNEEEISNELNGFRLSSSSEQFRSYQRRFNQKIEPKQPKQLEIDNKFVERTDSTNSSPKPFAPSFRRIDNERKSLILDIDESQKKIDETSQPKHVNNKKFETDFPTTILMDDALGVKVIKFDTDFPSTVSMINEHLLTSSISHTPREPESPLPF